MASLIIVIARAAWPYLLVLVLFFTAWLMGCRHVQSQWDQREAQLKAESNQLMLSAYEKNQHIQQALNQSAAIIGETYDAHQKNIGDLADRNRQLLDQRLQHDRASRRCSAVPNAAAAASIRDDIAAGNGTFLENAGASLVIESARADAVSESLRACQAYIAAIQNQFGDTSGPASHH